MDDRTVAVTITMKASQIAQSRALVTGIEMFPGTVINDLNAMVECAKSGTTAAGAENGRLMAELQGLALGTRQGQLALREIVGNAVMSDPDGRPGRLQ